MKLIIDSDTLSFAAAASAEEADVDIACARVDVSMQNLADVTKATDLELWVTGEGNFRYNVFPEYKRSRKDAYRPKWEKEAKQHLIDKWKANIAVGCEADDMCGVSAYANMDPPGEMNTILAHIDKDLNMIPGWHFSWEIIRLGKVVRPNSFYYVTPEEALYNFYYQLIVGDSTDGIKGVRGAGPKKAENVLADLHTESEMYNAVRDMYSCDEEMEMNGQVLWIWRKLNDNIIDRWNGLKGESKDS